MFKRLMLLVMTLALLVGMGVATAAKAGDGTLSGNMVYRWMGMNNYDQNSDIDDAVSESQLRTRIIYSGEVDDNVAYNVTVQNYRVLGDPNDYNDIYQATFTVKDFLADDLDMTFGRMPVAFGRQRVVGVEDWDLATDILFDGVLGSYGFEQGWLDFFWFTLNETYGSKYSTHVGDQNLMGLYMHYDANENFWFEPYALAVITENWNDPDIDNDRMFMFGSLFDYHRSGFHFYGEGVFQTGTNYWETKAVASQDISAFGGYAGLFYDFDAQTEPFIGFEFNYASGTEAGETDMKTFASPFGSRSDYLGRMNIVDWSNVIAYRFAGGFTPTTDLDLTADFYLFQLAEDNGGESNIGTELDIQMNYMLNDNVDLEGGLGLFTYDDQAQFGYVDPGDSMILGWIGARAHF